MKNKTTRPTPVEITLLVLAALSAVLLLTMTLLCLPYFNQDPESPHLQQVSPTEDAAPETEPSEETQPTLPPPESNPYGRFDFQYNEQNFLVCTDGPSVNGIDVSYHQGDIDWKQVKASGIDFAMIRVGYRGYGESGKLMEDVNFYQNIRGAIDAGLEVGVYFFSQALNLEEVEEEVNFVLQRIRPYEITMPVVYDWEYVSEEARTANMDARTLTDCSRHFCDLMEEAGYASMIYFNRNQARDLLYLEELVDYPFWLAAYNDRMPFAYKVEMWQYTDNGRVPGIEGPVDIDIMLLYGE